MVSKKIYKRVAVSFIAAGFLVNGIIANANYFTEDFTLKNANITGDANSNTTIATFKAKKTSFSDFGLTFNSTSSYKSLDTDSRRRSVTTNGLSVEIVDSSGNVKYTVTKNTNSVFEFNSLSNLTVNATYSIRVYPQVKGTEGRVHLVSVDDDGDELLNTPNGNTIDLIKLPMLDSVSAQSSSSLRLSYSTSSGYSMHYLGYRGTSSTTQSTAINGGSYITSTSSFDDTGLSSSTYYYYKICASRSDITSTNAYSVLCSTANSGTTSSSYVAETSDLISSSNDKTATDSNKVDTTSDANSDVETSTATLSNSDGSSSKITVTVPKDTTSNNNTDKKKTLTIENTNNTDTKITTKITSDVDTDIVVKQDGSFTASKTTANGNKLSVKGDSIGKTSISSESKTGSTVKVDIPAGADTTISADGSVTSNVKVDSSVSGKVDVQIKIDATTGKSSATVSQVVTINGKQVTQTFAVTDYDGTTESVTEFIKASNLRAVNGGTSGGIKKTFKSTRSFFASKKALSRATDYTGAKTVEIISTTQWQKFEEIVLFDGKRSLKLLLGGADIVIDGEKAPMIPNEEYLLPLEISDTSGVTTSTPVYSSNKLLMLDGWNLVSLPVDTTVDDMSTFGDYSISWAFSNSNKEWSKNPTTLNKAEGVWFKMNSTNEVPFTGDAYAPIVADLTTGWNLLGTGEDLTNFKSNNSLEAVWSFQNNKWSSNPETIYRGQGFWIKK